MNQTIETKTSNGGFPVHPYIEHIKNPINNSHARQWSNYLAMKFSLVQNQPFNPEPTDEEKIFYRALAILQLKGDERSNKIVNYFTNMYIENREYQEKLLWEN